MMGIGLSFTSSFFLHSPLFAHANTPGEVAMRSFFMNPRHSVESCSESRVRGTMVVVTRVLQVYEERGKRKKATHLAWAVGVVCGSECKQGVPK